MKSLLIVESPAKVKTLSKFLGKDFVILPSIGHVKDLPKKELGVDVDNGFLPQYFIIDGKQKVMNDLKKAAKKADRIYLAPDPDREGEAIAWHIAEELNSDPDKMMRVVFNEITERAVTEAIKNPRKLNMDLVDAQQARRVLDRLVGYKLSPLLWRKIRRGLSAGRVQSVALRLVVDREREIAAFKSVEYWSITANLEGKNPPPFDAKLIEVKGKKAEIGNESDAESVLKGLKGKDFTVSKVEKKSRKRSPAPPFITSTLQQEASRKLRFVAKKTMFVAQKLYEGLEIGAEGSVGLITYMRTDSVRVAKEAQDEAVAFIGKEFGKEYLPSKPPVYKGKKSAQDAHEAIRPTSVFRTPEKLKGHLSSEELRLYTLVWNRFVASQMNPAQLEQTSVDIAADKYNFRATGTVVKFPGFMKIYIEGVDTDAEEEGLLPSLAEGDRLKTLSITPKQHFTQPPPRYTEPTLVRDLEAKGIGRPSTYATILSTIQDREYVSKEGGRFTATELGLVVNDLLVARFSELMDYNFTAKMEDNLDKIAEGVYKWTDIVNDFYRPFDRLLGEALENTDRVKPADIPTDEKCEKCGNPMVIKWGRHGRFMACTGYPECKNTRPLEGEAAEAAGQTAEVEKTDEKCAKCGSDMVFKVGKFGKFLACSNYPKCKNTKAISIGIKCPEDGGDIVEKRSKKGKVFFGCANYPKCSFASWYRPTQKKCPECGTGILGEKKTKKEEALVCLNKACHYKEEILGDSGEETETPND